MMGYVFKCRKNKYLHLLKLHIVGCVKFSIVDDVAYWRLSSCVVGHKVVCCAFMDPHFFFHTNNFDVRRLS